MRTFLCLTLALCAADALKSKSELVAISTHASASETAWGNLFYQQHWTDWCQTANGTADKIESLAQCKQDLEHGTWAEEFRWYWRGFDVGFVNTTVNCTLDELFCKPSWSDVVGPRIGPSESMETSAYVMNCMAAESDDYDDDMGPCNTCGAGEYSFCCCEGMEDYGSCSADTPDPQCTNYANPQWGNSVVCPVGIIDTIPAEDALRQAINGESPDLMLEALITTSRLAFRPVNAGEVRFSNPNIDLCEVLIFEPYNIGSLIVNGSANASFLLINPNNAPTVDDSLTFASGSVKIYGGVNYGPGPIEFSSTGTIVVARLENQGTVNVAGGTDVSIVSVNNTGTVTCTDTIASIYDVTNAGDLTVTGGSYAIYDTVNTGDVTITGGSVVASGLTNTGGVITATDVTSATIQIDANSGTVTCTGCTDIDITIDDNTGGVIDLSDSGNTGSLTVNGGMGTITVNDGIVLTTSAPTPGPVDDATPGPVDNATLTSLAHRATTPSLLVVALVLPVLALI